MLTQARPRAEAVDQAEHPAPKPRFSAEVWLLVGLTVVGAALRFATLTSQSYWLDESTTVHEVGMSFGALLHAVRVNETTPPLYFVLAWLWSKLFGTGEAGLRSLSAIAGVAVIPIAYLCGRELVSRRAGLVAAALTAVSPLMIWYSQEARSYMLLVAFCGASFLFFARGWKAPSSRNVYAWALFSGLAVLTHFFAGFLVAPEAVLLLYRARNRAGVIAVGAVAIVQAAVLPLAVSDTTHPLNWINAFPLAVRIQQVPTEFGLGSLYQSSLVSYGLLAAAALSACLIALLLIGATRSQLIGAGVAAGLVVFVVLVPLVLAVLGRDYYVARNLMPAWIPLTVVIGAACTAPRARRSGAALAVAVLAVFVWAGIRIDDNPQYQRPNWRGVAAALGSPVGTRAVIAYDGTFATGPLAIYLHGISWSGPTQAPPVSTAPVTVSEVDVVGNVWDTTPATLPAGVRLVGRRRVDNYLVERFALSPAWNLTPAEIALHAGALLGPQPAGLPGVLIQPPA